jgi:hypothetical protein
MTNMNFRLPLKIQTGRKSSMESITLSFIDLRRSMIQPISSGVFLALVPTTSLMMTNVSAKMRLIHTAAQLLKPGLTD